MTKRRDQKEPRPSVRLNSKLDRNLANYVAVAGAAGVAMLAATQPAEAKIVYTPANTQLNFGYHGTLPLDLNNDGITDITFSGGSSGMYNASALRVYGAPGNAVVGANNLASALVWGVRVGPTDSVSSRGIMAVAVGCYENTCIYSGDWMKTHQRYLGVKFSISGQIHYGWISVNVGNNPNGAVLTGYAYETSPNKPIIAGKKSGPVVVSAVDAEEVISPSHQVATLGLLARGADALAIWRREEAFST